MPNSLELDLSFMESNIIGEWLYKRKFIVNLIAKISSEGGIIAISGLPK